MAIRLLTWVKSHQRQAAFGGAALLIILLAVYWRHQVRYPSTDDAYVQADVINIAAEVSGQLQTLGVRNNQQVKKGTVLFVINDSAYRYARDQAQAQLAIAEQQVKSFGDAVTAAQALVNERSAELNNSLLNYQRMTTLTAKGTVPKAQGDDAKSQYLVAQAALNAAQAQLQQAQDQLGSDHGHAQLAVAHANLQQALLNLAHTVVTAPANGIVTQLNLRQGAVITSGQPLFQFIENEHWWVDANFKETQLTRIKPGQTAKITIDTYPNYRCRGQIESVSSGSGEAFSLLPPENASGNWVKVTQRIPVKVTILNLDPQFPLRVGLSATVAIDTSS